VVGIGSEFDGEMAIAGLLLGSVIDLDRSLLCFWRNLGSLEGPFELDGWVEGLAIWNSCRGCWGMSDRHVAQRHKTIIRANPCCFTFIIHNNDTIAGQR
jgi:hypothetical protein